LGLLFSSRCIIIAAALALCSLKEEAVRKVNPVGVLLGAALLLTMTALPYVYYRYNYSNAKRLRPVVAGRVYRSGCLTADGFKTAIRKYGIKTVINLQEEAVDPDLPANYFDRATRIRESELCASLGARLEFVFVDLVPRNRVGKERPATLDRFLEIMDNPANYPVLIHCKAGLHRTGVLSAVYRIEYEQWHRLDAWHELRAHGFGEFTSDATNDYIAQYILRYEPGVRRSRIVPATTVSRQTTGR
jgi:tyrosine-protein phosphatase SIW14